MNNATQYIAILEKILTLLKSAKLEYLKASDVINRVEDKRYLNLQSTLRNRLFQDVTQLLRSKNVDVESLIIRRLNYEQIVISSIKKTKHSLLYKCIENDKNLLDLYDQAIGLESNASLLKAHKEKISMAVKESAHLLEDAGYILES